MLAIRSAAEAGSPPDLLGLLLACHQRIRTFIALANTIGEDRSASATEIRAACQRCERYFVEALPLHVLDEELSLLPRLLAAQPALASALQCMHAEHVEHDLQVVTLIDLLRSVAAEPASAGQRSQLAIVAAKLQIEFASHLQAEETAIFPWIAQALSPADQAAVMHELRARRQPTR